jgi:cytochrome c553
LTGDIDADMARIAAFYADKTGKRPENAGPVRLGDGG